MSEAQVPNPLAEGIQATRRAPPGVLVVFGASGDLTKRKLLPALGSLCRRRLLSPSFAVVGVARTALDDEAFRDLLQKHGRPTDLKTALRQSAGVDAVTGKPGKVSKARAK